MLLQRSLKEIREQNGNGSCFERNLERLRKVGLECYFTFTGMPEESIERFKEEHLQWDYTDSFGIELVHYKALDYKESV